MDNIKDKFLDLRETWIKETGHVASPKERAIHPAYQQIIGMGPKVVPFLIRDQLENNTHWFWALQSITGENPIEEEHEGYIQKMAQDWKEWWNEQLMTGDVLKEK